MAVTLITRHVKYGPQRVSYVLIKHFIFRQELALVVGVERNRRGVTELHAIRGIRRNEMVMMLKT